MRKAKVLALDFDNTLWDGVMAEGDVVQHHDRQASQGGEGRAECCSLRSARTTPPTMRWDEMTFSAEDFVLQKIGWNLKVESIAAAAKQLELGIDSFVFLDDKSAERDRAVAAPHGPVLDSTDPFTWRVCRRLLQFPNTQGHRGSPQPHRALPAAGATPGGAERRLRLPDDDGQPGIVDRVPARAVADLDRVTELVQRTNQFNTTTKRYTRQQLQGLLTSDRHRVYVATLADKFGSLGLVAVVIVERRSDEAVFDSFVMSCRAMGFQLEHAVVRLVLDAEPGVSALGGAFRADGPEHARGGPLRGVRIRCPRRPCVGTGGAYVGSRRALLVHRHHQ